MSDICSLSLTELSAGLRQKEFSSVEATSAYLKAIDENDSKYGAYLDITKETALREAKAADKKIADGDASPLCGVPAAYKDNICTKGIKTTCASKMLESFVPPYSATAYEKMQAVGCVTLGKLNMDEFAMGSSNENSAFKPVRNPRDVSRVPGGSSGGAAACVAADEAAFALGSDTGGSIRQPAAFCGVVGMKPTYGSVSRYGLIAFASSLDQIGPLTKTVKDSALVMNALCGYDAHDSTSVKRDYAPFDSQIGQDIKGMRIALPQIFLENGISDDVKTAVLNAAKQMEALGAVIVDAKLPSLKYALPAYYVISSAEASSNLARFDGVRYGHRAEEYGSIEELYLKSRSEGFGPEVKRRIMLGTFTLSAGYFDAYYKKALQVRTLIKNEYDQVFTGCDAILGPVAPTTAYHFGEKSNPLEMYMGDIFTVPVNIAGIPALSLPCGLSKDQMPVGMQLMGKPFSEPSLYRIAYAFEQSAQIDCGRNKK